MIISGKKSAGFKNWAYQIWLKICFRTTNQIKIKREDLEQPTFVTCTLIKEEPDSNIKEEHDIKPKPDCSASWPSLWKNEPRRSAFKPYKVRCHSICSYILLSNEKHI